MGAKAIFVLLLSFVGSILCKKIVARALELVNLAHKSNRGVPFSNALFKFPSEEWKELISDGTIVAAMRIFSARKDHVRTIECVDELMHSPQNISVHQLQAVAVILMSAAHDNKPSKVYSSLPHLLKLGKLENSRAFLNAAILAMIISLVLKDPSSDVGGILYSLHQANLPLSSQLHDILTDADVLPPTYTTNYIKIYVENLRNLRKGTILFGDWYHTKRAVVELCQHKKVQVDIGDIVCDRASVDSVNLSKHSIAAAVLMVSAITDDKYMAMITLRVLSALKKDTASCFTGSLESLCDCVFNELLLPRRHVFVDAMELLNEATVLSAPSASLSQLTSGLLGSASPLETVYDKEKIRFDIKSMQAYEDNISSQDWNDIRSFLRSDLNEFTHKRSSLKSALQDVRVRNLFAAMSSHRSRSFPNLDSTADDDQSRFSSRQYPSLFVSLLQEKMVSRCSGLSATRMDAIGKGEFLGGILVLGDGDLSFSRALLSIDRILRDSQKPSTSGLHSDLTQEAFPRPFMDGSILLSTSLETPDSLTKKYKANYTANRMAIESHSHAHVFHSIDATLLGDEIKSHLIDAVEDLMTLDLSSALSTAAAWTTSFDFVVFNFPFADTYPIDGAAFSTFNISRGRHMQLLNGLFRCALVLGDAPTLHSQAAPTPPHVNFPSPKRVSWLSQRPYVVITLLIHQAVAWELEAIAVANGYVLEKVLPFEAKAFAAMGYCPKRTYNHDSFPSQMQKGMKANMVNLERVSYPPNSLADFVQRQWRNGQHITLNPFPPTPCGMEPSPALFDLAIATSDFEQVDSFVFVFRPK